MDETIIRIPLDRLRESPTNPRRHFGEESLKELSFSIAGVGVIEPIIVRPAPNRPGEQNNLLVTHEIVVGHRRYRASLLAEQIDIPCVVRDLTDEQVRVMQIHENLHRDDVNPVEEADGLAELMTEHNIKVDDLARRTGKSRSYIYARAKLASAAPAVREACLTQGLGGEIAQRIARIPSHKLQLKALEDMRGREWIDGKMQPVGWVSDREAKIELRRLLQDLDDAPFALADATLAARAGACTTCPKRAGNDPDLAADDVPANTCVDTECYSVKVEAFHAQVLAGARKAGREVIDGNAAESVLPYSWDTHQPRGYVRLDQVAYTQEGTDPDAGDINVTWAEAIGMAGLGKKAPKPALLVNPHREHDYIDVITDDQADELMRRLGRDPETGLPPSTAAQAQEGAAGRQDDEPDTRPPELRAFDDWELWPRVRREIMRRVVAGQRTLEELRLVVGIFFEIFDDVPNEAAEHMGWKAQLDALNDYDDEMDFVQARIAELDADSLGRLLVLLALQNAPLGHGPQSDAKLALAQTYGIDVLALAAEGSEEEPEQTDDAGVAGGSDAQAELLADAEA